MRVVAKISCLAVMVLTVAAAETLPAQAQSAISIREQALLEGVGFEEMLGNTVDTSAHFFDQEGNSVSLADYLGTDKPVILNFAYYNCPVICSVMLDQISSSLNELDLELSTDYDVVTVSFSPDEGPELAARARETFRKKVAGSDGWHFLTGTSESIDQLTTSVGFKYKWMDDSEEYAHPAALIFLTDDGTVTRYLHGLQYESGNIQKALVEAADGRIGSVWDQVVMYCFRFDPSSNSYVVQATNLMKLGGGITVLALSAFLSIYWVREKKRRSEITLVTQ